MNRYVIIRSFLLGVMGIVIGVIVTAVVNLMSPAENLLRTLVVVCFAAFVSAFLASLLSIRRKKEP